MLSNKPEISVNLFFKSMCGTIVKDVKPGRARCNSEPVVWASPHWVTLSAPASCYGDIPALATLAWILWMTDLALHECQFKSCLMTARFICLSPSQ